MNFARSFSLLIFCMVLTACGTDNKSNNTNPPDKDPVKITEADPDPVLYPVIITPLELNHDFNEPTPFSIPQKAKEGQEVTISFNFNSKSNSKMKLMMTSYASHCTGTVPSAKQILIKYSPKREVVYEDVNVVFDYDVVPNTDYALEVVTTPSNCDKYSVGVAVWLGNVNQDPTIVKTCTGVSDTSTGSYYQLMNHTPVIVYKSFDSQFLGQNILCGKEVEASEKEWNISQRPYRASGLYKGNNGVNYSFDLEYDESRSKGLLVCSEGDSSYFEMDLEDCRDKVMDKNLFSL